MCILFTAIVGSETWSGHILLHRLFSPILVHEGQLSVTEKSMNTLDISKGLTGSLLRNCVID